MSFRSSTKGNPGDRTGEWGYLQQPDGTSTGSEEQDGVAAKEREAKGANDRRSWGGEVQARGGRNDGNEVIVVGDVGRGFLVGGNQHLQARGEASITSYFFVSFAFFSLPGLRWF